MRKLPNDDKEFEKLVRDCVSGAFHEHFDLYGRNGQKQFGADVVAPQRKIIVQCKCYDINNKNAYENLTKSIQHDYPEACNHFKEMTLFIVATTLNRDSTVQDRFLELQRDNTQKDGREVEIRTLFWEDIEELCEKYETRNANEEYAIEFEESLFLHKTDPSVCLKNLYVQQDYEVVRCDRMKQTSGDLFHYLASFVSDPEERLMIIEGDAGNGKTSLSKALCWNHKNNTVVAQDILQDRPLVTIRLRDLNKAHITSEEGIAPAILEYLHIKDYDAFYRRYQRAVLLLDGYDELCIIEGIKDSDHLLYRLGSIDLPDCKIIVTSRPNYIHREINLTLCIISLQHFGADKREQWLEYFTAPERCNQNVSEDLRQYILCDTEEGACDTPLTLYLIASNSFPTEWLNNTWKVYHQIFSKEITERPYDSKPHPGLIHTNTVYQVAEEISFSMFGSAEEIYYLESKEICKIVDRLTPPSGETDANEVRQLISRSTSLCSYWKVFENRGAVEFYHNNIRDFFLCEKIYRVLNTIYGDRHLTRPDKIKQMIELFRDDFRLRFINQKTCQFLYLRSLFAASHKIIEFPAQEREQQLLPELFELMLCDRTVIGQLVDPPLVSEIATSLRCIAQIFRAVLDPYLEKGELIIWWNNVEKVNESKSLLFFFPVIFANQQPDVWWANPGTYGNFDDIYLHSLSFGKRTFEVPGLSKSSFEAAVLINADMQHCYLENADLNYADLIYAYLAHAYLSNAHLQFAELSYSNLSDACLYKADLKGADLHDAILQHTDLNRANLSRSNLQGTNLEKANLSYANLSGAKLEKAILPDGFQSPFQAEQRAHLLSMNIPGLKL